MFTEDDFVKKPFQKVHRNQGLAVKKKMLWVLFSFALVACVVIILFGGKECIGGDAEQIDTVDVVNGDTDQCVQGVANVAMLELDTANNVVAPNLNSANVALSDGVSGEVGPINAPPKKVVPKDDIKAIDVHLMAKRVIRGDFGNGDDRKRALQNNYQVIQHQVNLNYRNGDLNW